MPYLERCEGAGERFPCSKHEVVNALSGSISHSSVLFEGGKIKRVKFSKDSRVKAHSASFDDKTLFPVLILRLLSCVVLYSHCDPRKQRRHDVNFGLDKIHRLHQNAMSRSFSLQGRKKA